MWPASSTPVDTVMMQARASITPFGECTRTPFPPQPILETGVSSSIGRFVASLHEKGICFGAGHLNNYLKCSAGGFGLIDVTDVAFSFRPLRRKQRLRNIHKLIRTDRDSSLIAAIGWEPFFKGYSLQCQTFLGRKCPIFLEELDQTFSPVI